MLATAAAGDDALRRIQGSETTLKPRVCYKHKTPTTPAPAYRSGFAFVVDQLTVAVLAMDVAVSCELNLDTEMLFVFGFVCINYILELRLKIQNNNIFIQQ